MNKLNLTASRRRNQVVILSGIRPDAKLSTSAAARLLSLTDAAKKICSGACSSENSSYLCNALQSERATKLATPAGNFFARAIKYSVPTPVWSVNAPTARSECSATGKRNRFSFLSAIVNYFHSCTTMKAMNLTASRRRNQVVILSGIRPDAKLSTSKTESKSCISADTQLLIAMFSLVPCGAAATSCVLLGDLTGSPLWMLGFLASWAPAVLVNLFWKKGGRK